MKLIDTHHYTGIFTGKMIKPMEDEKTDKFQKGDKVIVFHLDDFISFLKTADIIIHGTPEEIRAVKEKYNL